MSTSGAIVISENVDVLDIMDYLVTAPGREDRYDGFYTMNINKVAERYEKMAELLPRVRPFYAVKCNPDPVLVRLLSKLGTGFDCASKGEIRLAIGMGATPNDIVYSNPVKELSHIRFAKKCGVSMMAFDCESELHKIKKEYPESEILLRFRPITAGYDTDGPKFGVPQRHYKDLLTSAKKLGMNVVGISFHSDSGIVNGKPFVDAVEKAKGMFDVGEKLGFFFRILDIGGGFPGKENDSFEKACKMVNSALDKYFPVGCGVRIIAEPGRYFACSPYTLVTNITTVKEIKKQDIEENEKENPPVPFADKGPETGYMYYINDGRYGSFMRPDVIDFEPKALGVLGNILFPSCIWGQTCEFCDGVTNNCMLPKLSAGDWLYFENMGAYTRAFYTTFNGFPNGRYTYYYVTPNTWEEIKPDMEKFDFDILEF